MTYILAVHVPIAGMALLTVLFGLPVMLFPMHMAFLELVIDPACSIVFENEAAEADIMQRPPRLASARLFGGRTLLLSLLQGVVVLLVVLASYIEAIQVIPEAQARTFAFVILIIANLLLIFFNRSRQRQFLYSWRSPNISFVIVSVFTLGVLALLIYVPFLAAIFHFAALPFQQLLLAAGLGFTGVVWMPLLGCVWRNPA
jgi:P-type Ca2+ transporter type 2C